MTPSDQPVRLITFIVIVTLLWTANSANDFSCGPGHYKHGASGCEPCPEGTYISDLNHNSIDCIPCYSADTFSHEYEAKKCTSTTDTKILCTPTHYRQDYPPEPALGECIRCSSCGVGDFKELKALVKSCDNYTDTLCCENAEFEAQKFFGAFGRIYLQCVHSSDSTTASVDSATSATDTADKSSQQTREPDSLPSVGRKLTSTDSSVVVITLVWTFILTL